MAERVSDQHSIRTCSLRFADVYQASRIAALFVRASPLLRLPVRLHSRKSVGTNVGTIVGTKGAPWES
jgi:hypothetical protein